MKPEINENQYPAISTQQLMFGEIVQWITILSSIIAMIAPIFILALPGNNVLNPSKIFSLIFTGKGKDIVWASGEAGFPGGHFYLSKLLTGDGFAQFGVAIGCSVALWALIPSIILYFKKKDYLYGSLCTFISLLIILAMTGLVSME